VSAAMGDPAADVDALMKKMERLQTEIDSKNGWEIERIKERAMDALRCPPPDALVPTPPHFYYYKSPYQ
jgi:hypothetical protein